MVLLLQLLHYGWYDIRGDMCDRCLNHPNQTHPLRMALLLRTLYCCSHNSAASPAASPAAAAALNQIGLYVFLLVGSDAAVVDTLITTESVLI